MTATIICGILNHSVCEKFRYRNQTNILIQFFSKIISNPDPKKSQVSCRITNPDPVHAHL